MPKKIEVHVLWSRKARSSRPVTIRAVDALEAWTQTVWTGFVQWVERTADPRLAARLAELVSTDLLPVGDALSVVDVDGGPSSKALLLADPVRLQQIRELLLACGKEEVLGVVAKGILPAVFTSEDVEQLDLPDFDGGFRAAHNYLKELGGPPQLPRGTKYPLPLA